MKTFTTNLGEEVEKALAKYYEANPQSSEEFILQTRYIL